MSPNQHFPSLRTRNRAVAGGGGGGGGGSRRAATTKCSATAAAVVGQQLGQRELYGQLCTKLKEVERLAGIQGLLSWDEQVHSPPCMAAVCIPFPASDSSFFSRKLMKFTVGRLCLSDARSSSFGPRWYDRRLLQGCSLPCLYGSYVQHAPADIGGAAAAAWVGSKVAGVFVNKLQQCWV